MGLSTRTKFFLPVGLLFSLIGLGFSSAWLKEFKRQDAFSRALVTQGVVTGHRTETIHTNSSRSSVLTPGKSDYVYIAAYEYSVDRKPYKAEQVVQNPAHIEDGMTVPVFYVAGNPADGLIEKPVRVWMFLMMGGPFLLFGLGMLFASVPEAIGAVRFGATSVEVQGSVISVSDAPYIVNGVTAQTLYYTFRDADGGEHRGFSKPVLPRDVYKPGSTVKVRYRASDPEESEIVSANGATTYD